MLLSTVRVSHKAALSLLLPVLLCAQPGARTLTIAQAVAEAVDNNLSVLAERANIPVAEATLLTARIDFLI